MYHAGARPPIRRICHPAGKRHLCLRYLPSMHSFSYPPAPRRHTPSCPPTLPPGRIATHTQSISITLDVSMHILPLLPPPAPARSAQCIPEVRAPIHPTSHGAHRVRPQGFADRALQRPRHALVVNLWIPRATQVSQHSLTNRTTSPPRREYQGHCMRRTDSTAHPRKLRTRPLHTRPNAEPHAKRAVSELRLPAFRYAQLAR